MKFTLERILIIIQVVLLIGKITGWLLIPWVWVLVPLWAPMAVMCLIYIGQEIKEYRIKNKS